MVLGIAYQGLDGLEYVCVGESNEVELVLEGILKEGEQSWIFL